MSYTRNSHAANEAEEMIRVMNEKAYTKKGKSNLKAEKKRIHKLYEATTASASGSYNQPMAFTEPVETIDVENTFIDGDNVVDGSVEITLDIDELSDLLNVTDEDEEERIRESHKNNSIIKEQDEKRLTCTSCIEKALGRYAQYSTEVIEAISDMTKDGKKPGKTEFVELMKKTLYVLLSTRVWDIVPISLRLYGCIDVCMDKGKMDPAE